MRQYTAVYINGGYRSTSPRQEKGQLQVNAETAPYKKSGYYIDGNTTLYSLPVTGGKQI